MTLPYEIAVLLFYLVVIIAACELFANAVESLGAKLNFSEGVTGSIFAAVGTALPESMVPIVAIAGAWIGGNGAEAQMVAEEVGVGAILGAPFMLATLAMALSGGAAWWFKARRKKESLTPERTGFRRDVEFFLFCFTLAFLTAFVPQEYRVVRIFIALVLVVTYFYYVLETLKASEALVEGGHGVEETNDLYIAKVFKDHMTFVVIQLLIGLALIIVGAHGFVHGVESLSKIIGIPVIAVSLLIIPVATELPEKINSVIWIRNSKDTMALGNITGAMVFQGSILPAIGIFLTPWAVNPTVVVCGFITTIAGLWLYYLIRRKGGEGFRPAHFVPNALLYIVFIVFAIMLAF